MHVLVGGGTGFVGSRLSRALQKKGHRVTNLSRSPSPKVPTLTWDELKQKGLPECDAVVNLSGQGVMDKSWTPTRKLELIESRVAPTQAIIQQIKTMTKPPKVYVGASAVGYYPTQTPQIFTEEYAGPPAANFGGELCSKIEASSRDLRTDVRRVIVRIGVVLDDKQGAFPQMKLPLGLAYLGTIGDGNQYFPWVHVDDLVNLFICAIEGGNNNNNNNTPPVGVLNGVAPHIITQKQFTESLRKVFKKPTVPMPKFVVDTMFGERALLLTEGQAVSPKFTEEKFGFKFNYRNIDDALKDLKMRGSK